MRTDSPVARYLRVPVAPLVSALTLLIHPLAFAQSPADPAARPDLPPSAAGLDAGKVAEEGDHDLDRAAKEYRSVLATYEALRPRAAEAMFRLAEMAAKLQQVDEAQRLYTRVVVEFPTEGEFVQPSRERLVALGDPSAQTDAELHARYGIAPPNSTPGRGFGWGFGTFGGSGGGVTQSTANLPASVVQRYGFIGGGGGPSSGLGLAPSLPTPATPPNPYTVSISGGNLDKAAILRAEAARLAARLRQVRRERRAIEGADPQLIPTQLVEDPLMLQLIKLYDDTRVRVLDQGLALAASSVPDAQIQEQRQQGDREVSRTSQVLRTYLADTYLPRLKQTEEMLAAELEDLEKAAEKAVPRF